MPRSQVKEGKIPFAAFLGDTGTRKEGHFWQAPSSVFLLHLSVPSNVFILHHVSPMTLGERNS